VNIVGQIAREARAKNAPEGITGLLVFDGERFCQHLEGSSAPIKQLFERIKVDARHVRVELLHEGPSEQRRFLKFSMAFAQVEDSDFLQSMRTKVGSDAMLAFSELLPAVDMEP
jgi:hypothetical protein